MTTLAIPPALELRRHYDLPLTEYWVYETPAGGFITVLFNKTADGYVAHRSNDDGSWIGPRIVGGHSKGRGAVLDELEQLMDKGAL